ncbi:MAG: hypothetical protein OMM_12335, partial [Candidatus Magnetoglobus multicellularis str. Araruama]
MEVYSSAGTWQYSIDVEAECIKFDKNGKMVVLSKEYDSNTNSFVGTLSVYSDPNTLDYSISNNSNILSMPEGIAFDSSGNIYVADYGLNSVQIFSSSGSFQYSIGGDSTGNAPGEFALDSPRDVEVDGSGNIYVADTENHRIQVFTSSGEFQYTMGSQGTGLNEFNKPWGLEFDDNNVLFVIEVANNRVQAIGGEYAQRMNVSQYYLASGNMGIGTTNPTAKLEIAGSVKIVDGSQGAGKVLVSDASGKASWQEISTDIADGSITTVKIADNAITYTQIDSGTIKADRLAASDTTGLTDGTSGQNLVSNGDGTFRWETSASSSPFVSSEAAEVDGYTFGEYGVYQAGAYFYYPHDAVFDSSGLMYIADHYNHRVQVFNPQTGDFIRTIGEGTDVEADRDLSYPDDLAIGPDGDLFVADGDVIEVFSTAGTWQYTIGVKADVIHFDDNGIMRVFYKNYDGSNDTYFATMLVYSDPNTFDYSITYNSNILSMPEGIDFDSSGNMYIADPELNSVQVFSNSGSFQYSIGSDSTGNAPGEFGLGSPTDVELDSSGNIYVADTVNHRIQVFTSSGELQYTMGTEGTGLNEFQKPWGLIFDDNNVLLLSKFETTASKP